MRLRLTLAVGLLGLLSGCSSGGQSKPVWESAPGVDIPAFTTFDWVEEITRSPNTIRLGVGLGSYGGNVGGSVGSSVDVGGKEGVLQGFPESNAEIGV